MRRWGGGREAGRKTRGAARSLSSSPPPRAHPKGTPTPAAALAGPDPPGPTSTFRKTLRACPTEAGKMAEARFKCRRRRGRRRAEGAGPRGAEQRRRAQPRGSRARARRHGKSDYAGRSERRRGETGHVVRAGGNAHARRAGGPPEPAPSAGSRAHALTAGGRASRGRRPSPGLVGGKGGCGLSVACRWLAGTARPSSPRPVSTHTLDLAGGGSLGTHGRRPQNEWSE